MATRESQELDASLTLHEDDLIDDRELDKVDDDRLDHAGIVEQLAALATTVRTPANVALYGPWGSGKSGIANLLKEKVDGENGVRFARFDAFKYAQLPLRRNFISATATELGCSGREYHDGLYSGETRTNVSVPASTLWKLIGVFALLMASLTLILGVIIAAVAWAQKGEFTDSFRSLSKAAVLAGLLPAALLAAFISLASKTFHVDRSVTKPESDEQFEQLFKNLVKSSGAKRLVVFVDELDRCAASEVVATLDTVRTFLGIDKCVFIIAADQQVLEEALTRAARQETPTDDTNPYYSTGSAYLDKVFQYQMSLPPLLTQRVSKYAAILLQERKGLWSDINTGYVLSVLIPTHVTSPRRVKHLINTFALTYRLAEKRHLAHLLAEDPRDNPAAVARLVCLRVEFPLFARHLEVAPSLPDLVLEVMDHRDGESMAFPDGVSERVQELAKSYALHGAAPGRILSEPRNDEEGSGEVEDSSESTSGPITKTHNKQLLSYLRRTQRVRGPSRDLVFMQSTGTVFGLDGQVAISVEQAAENVDTDTMRAIFGGLDDLSRQAVLQLLAQQIRAGLGLAAPNTARSFLHLLETYPDLDVRQVVDTVAASICSLHDAGDVVLEESTIQSAWNLANAGTEAGATSLRSLIITVATSDDWDHSTDFLVGDASIALDSEPGKMAPHLASAVVSARGGSVLETLFGFGDADLVRLLAAIDKPLSEAARSAATAHAKWAKTQEAAAGTPAVPSAAAAGAPAEPPAESEPFDPEAVFSELVSRARPRETPVQHQTLRILLDINVTEARSAALDLIGDTEPTTETKLISKLLIAMNRRALKEWPSWLSGVASEGVQATHSTLIGNLAKKAWSTVEDESVLTPALMALMRVAAALPDVRRPNLTPDILSDTDFWARTSDQAAALQLVVSKARLFAQFGLVDESGIFLPIVQALQDNLANTLTELDHEDPLYMYVTGEGAHALRAVASEVHEETLAGIYAEALTSPWLGPADRVEVALRLADSATATPATVRELVGADTIADLTSKYGSSSSGAACLWTKLVHPTPDELAAAYENLRAASAINQEFAKAVAVAQMDWTTDQHVGFLSRYLSSPDTPVPEDVELLVLGLASCDEAKVADLLVDRFVASTNNTQRKGVVTLWKAAQIQESQVRKRLIEQIIFGLLDLNSDSGENVGAADLALSALGDLGAPLPRGVKGSLGDRVRNAVHGDESLEEKALRVLPGLGYPVQSGWFGRNKQVDFDS